MKNILLKSILITVLSIVSFHSSFIVNALDNTGKVTLARSSIQNIDYSYYETYTAKNGQSFKIQIIITGEIIRNGITIVGYNVQIAANPSGYYSISHYETVSNNTLTVNCTLTSYSGQTFRSIQF